MTWDFLGFLMSSARPQKSHKIPVSSVGSRIIGVPCRFPGALGDFWDSSCLTKILEKSHVVGGIPGISQCSWDPTELLGDFWDSCYAQILLQIESRDFLHRRLSQVRRASGIGER